MGKLIYGNQNFGFAPIQNSSGTYSFGTPVILNGMVSSSAEVEQEETKKYADNKVYCIVAGEKVRNLSAVMKYITEGYAEYLGFKAHDNGFLTDTGRRANHCVFFESLERDCETEEETRTLHYFYNVKAQEPTEETTTTTEEVEEQELTIEYESLKSDFVIDKDGKYVAYGKITRTEANKNLYDSFLTKVLMPTDAIPQQ